MGNLKSLLLLLCSLFLIITSIQVQYTLNGAGNNSWHVASKWNPASVFSSEDETIPNVANHPIIDGGYRSPGLNGEGARGWDTDHNQLRYPEKPGGLIFRYGRFFLLNRISVQKSLIILNGNIFNLKLPACS